MGTRPWWGRDVRVLRNLRAPPAGNDLWLETDAEAMSCNPAAIGVKVVPDAISQEDCQRVLEAARQEPCERGSLIGGYDATRECHCTWLPDTAHTGWLYDRVGELFIQANRAFGFELSGMVEPVMAACYSEGDYFDWHLDAGPELAANRKLSMSILLARPETYEGGDLEICGAAAPYRQVEAGTAIVFPSFLSHRVTRIARGRRLSLVAFAHGPTFR
jgi:PKHD-type hydroxylase